MEDLSTKTPEPKRHHSDDELNFKNGNPGSVLYGNFINYYKFHPPNKRISLLPQDVWDTIRTEDCCCVLDVGCNAGELTLAIHEFLSKRVGITNCNVLGVDIDPLLIQRANELKDPPENSNIEFLCIDIMHSDKWNKTYLEYLKKYNKDKFSVVFCFSVTMWIHLNHGDEGLKIFLKLLSQISNILVIEPQPWKCYKTAKKRLRLSNEEFPEFNNIKMRENIEDEIESFLKNDCGREKLRESGRTEWGRKLLFFKC